MMNYDLTKLSPIEIYKLLLTYQIKKVPDGFWSKENSILCGKYLIEEVLEWSKEDIKNKALTIVFQKYKLSRPLKELFNNKIYDYINAIYPDQFIVEEIHGKKLKHHWKSKENIVKATKWLVEEKLHYNDNDIKNKLMFKDFKNYGLYSMMISNNLSVWDVINLTYPNKFKEWELKGSKLNEEIAIKAIKWMIEEELQWNDEQIKQKLNRNIFIEHGLKKILNHFGSLIKVLDLAYPKKFTRANLKNIQSQWNDIDIKKRLKTFIEEELNWNEEDIKKNFNTKIFRDNGLNGILYYFDYSPIRILNFLYPNKFKEWEIKSVAKGFWDKDENKIKAIRWLFEEKLKWDREDIIKKVSTKIFIENGLQFLCIKCGGVKKCLELAYPNEDWSKIKHNK